MTFSNEGVWDRAARILGGILLVYGGWSGVTSGLLSGVFLAAGGILLVTGSVGWCPLYRLAGLSTRHPR